MKKTIISLPWPEFQKKTNRMKIGQIYLKSYFYALQKFVFHLLKLLATLIVIVMLFKKYILKIVKGF